MIYRNCCCQCEQSLGGQLPRVCLLGSWGIFACAQPHHSHLLEFLGQSLVASPVILYEAEDKRSLQVIVSTCTCPADGLGNDDDNNNGNDNDDDDDDDDDTDRENDNDNKTL